MIFDYNINLFSVYQKNNIITTWTSLFHRHSICFVFFFFFLILYYLGIIKLYIPILCVQHTSWFWVCSTIKLWYFCLTCHSLLSQNMKWSWCIHLCVYYTHKYIILYPFWDWAPLIEYIFFSRWKYAKNVQATKRKWYFKILNPFPCKFKTIYKHIISETA
jgi:hypothetical protein